MSRTVKKGWVFTLNQLHIITLYKYYNIASNVHKGDENETF